MAPALHQPLNINFADDPQKLVNVDAATYYGGGESYARSRTYSAVSVLHT